jgi:DNA-binding transcriptional ArsR family regulator
MKKSATGISIPDEMTITDLEVVRIVSDRTRLRVLEAFGRSRGPRTVKQVAAELGELPTKLYYHVNLLEGAGLLVVAESSLVSGILEKRYTPAAKSFRIERRLLDEAGSGGAESDAVGSMAQSIMDSTTDDFRRSLASGLLEQSSAPDQPLGWVLSRASFHLSQATARRLAGALREVLSTEDDDDATGTYAMTVAFFQERTEDDEK